MPRLPDHVVGDIARRIFDGLGQPAIDAIWGPCLSPAGESIEEQPFIDAIRAGAVKNLLVYVDYPDVTLEEIRAAVSRHWLLLSSAGSATPI